MLNNRKDIHNYIKYLDGVSDSYDEILKLELDDYIKLNNHLYISLSIEQRLKCKLRRIYDDIFSMALDVPLTQVIVGMHHGNLKSLNKPCYVASDNFIYNVHTFKGNVLFSHKCMNDAIREYNKE